MIMFLKEHGIRTFDQSIKHPELLSKLMVTRKKTDNQTKKEQTT